MAVIITLSQGAVTLSPSGVISVCNGGQLELNCTITDSVLLVWNVSSINAPMSITRTISSSSPFDQTVHAMINSTNLTFSRISAQHSSPLISRLLINPVSNHLNGTEVNCVNSMTSESSSVAVVNVSSSLIQGITELGCPIV